MKIFFLMMASCVSMVFSAEKLRIYDDTDAQTPLYQTSDYSQITEKLSAIGVRFEKWEASQTLSPDAQESEVFNAYRQDIERLMLENHYQAIDVVRMFPDSLKKVELRNKFLKEHIHTEDEVRFFVEGSGLFYLHTQEKVFIVLCERGDLISIPANYPHWFDMGDTPYFTAIRFFNDPSGWIANFTGSPISESFP